MQWNSSKFGLNYLNVESFVRLKECTEFTSDKYVPIYLSSIGTFAYVFESLEKLHEPGMIDLEICLV